MIPMMNYAHEPIMVERGEAKLVLAGTHMERSQICLTSNFFLQHLHVCHNESSVLDFNGSPCCERTFANTHMKQPPAPCMESFHPAFVSFINGTGSHV